MVTPFRKLNLDNYILGYIHENQKIIMGFGKNKFPTYN
jgi:hypothetical protein